jgi:hypothetical protein
VPGRWRTLLLMSGFGSRPPTWAVQQVGSCLRYTGHQINIVFTAVAYAVHPCRLSLPSQTYDPACRNLVVWRSSEATTRRQSRVRRVVSSSVFAIVALIKAGGGGHPFTRISSGRARAIAGRLLSLFIIAGSKKSRSLYPVDFHQFE